MWGEYKPDTSYQKIQPGLQTFWPTQELSQQPFSVGGLVGITNSWAAHFWNFCSQSASSHCIYTASASQYLKLVTLLDYSLVTTPDVYTRTGRTKGTPHCHSYRLWVLIRLAGWTDHVIANFIYGLTTIVSHGQTLFRTKGKGLGHGHRATCRPGM